ncbi:MAG: MFS transporter [Sphaerochaetaceae bacterium]
MGVTRLKNRQWTALILFGLFGQIAWMIENMYFNVFLYKTTTGDVGDIATMVASSAIVATVTTLLMGSLSDRIGHRKAFICIGYLLWGLSTMAFAFIRTENLQNLLPAAQVAYTAVVLIIVMDCLMTFFGSTANDAAFNAWVTDITDTSNRGTVESFLAAMPLVALLVVFGLLDSLTQAGEWSLFFLLVGCLTSLTGILGFFILQDAPALKSNRDPFGKQIIHGMRPSVIREHRDLYLVYVALAVFGMSVQIYMPYFIIYMEQWLLIKDYAVVLGLVFILSSVAGVLLGRWADKVGRQKTAVLSIILYALGLVGLFLVKTPATVVLAGVVMMTGNLLVSMNLNARVRDLTPEGKVGLFQGVRMFFTVLFPMVTGPFIGSRVISGSTLTYEEFGVAKSVPTPAIFLAAAIGALLIILPYRFSLGSSKPSKTQGTGGSA